MSQLHKRPLGLETAFFSPDPDGCDSYARWEGHSRPLEKRSYYNGFRIVEMYFPQCFISGDYSGYGAIGIANRNWWEEEYPDGCGRWWHHWSGDFGSEGIAIRMTLPPEAYETLRALEDYPVIDEDLLGPIEMERQDEAWEYWTEYDYRRSLKSEFGRDVDSVTREGFERAAEGANEYWEDQMDGAYIRVEEIAKYLAKEFGADPESVPDEFGISWEDE